MNQRAEKWTRRYLLDTAVSLKKGDFNTPSIFQFFKKENGGLKLIFQNRRQATALCFGAQIISRRNNGFFIIPLRAEKKIYVFNMNIAF